MRDGAENAEEAERGHQATREAVRDVRVITGEPGEMNLRLANIVILH